MSTGFHGPGYADAQRGVAGRARRLRPGRKERTGCAPTCRNATGDGSPGGSSRRSHRPGPSRLQEPPSKAEHLAGRPPRRQGGDDKREPRDLSGSVNHSPRSHQRCSISRSCSPPPPIPGVRAGPGINFIHRDVRLAQLGCQDLGQRAGTGLGHGRHVGASRGHPRHPRPDDDHRPTPGVDQRRSAHLRGIPDPGS